MCFGDEVPAFMELTAYDVPDERLGRPLGVVRAADVVRCVDGRPPWLRVALPSAPQGAWVFNNHGAFKEILRPVEVGPSPADPPDAPKTKTTTMVWYDKGDSTEAPCWFRGEPRLPKGSVLKIRARPNDDATVVAGLKDAHAVQAVCRLESYLVMLLEFFS
jgi:hypothetical protein